MKNFCVHNLCFYINLYIIIYKKGYILVKKLFALDDGIAKELEIVAKTLNTTQKDIVEKALDFYFDYTDTVLADKIVEDVENKKIKTYSKDETYKILGIE